jgi:hypothetical protein
MISIGDGTGSVTDVEQPLLGGWVSNPVRVGDTVRRSPGPNNDFVRLLLQHFERQGWSGGPRWLGVDDQGREILTYIDGDVPWQQPGRYLDGLAAAARLVRQCHDLTAGTALAGNQEVVCHNDLSPKNTVYRDGRPTALLDWDTAAPGERIHDVAHMCWQYLQLGPSATNPHGLRILCDAYGLTDRTHLIDTILWWQDRCAHGIETGGAATTKLRAAGTAREVRAAHAWVTAHRTELTRLLAT